MKNTLKYKTGWGFIDLLFNLLVGFTFMFILAFMLINPVAKKETVDPKAEYLVVVTWDNDSVYDIDTWVRDNDNNIVSFRGKDIALITLDRDDLGIANDLYTSKDGSEKIRKVNREVVAIRSDARRTYWISVHWFSKGQLSENSVYGYGADNYEPENQSTDRWPPIEVNIEVIRVNPFESMSTRRVQLDRIGQEEGVFKLTVENSKVASLEESDTKILYDTTRIKKDW